MLNETQCAGPCHDLDSLASENANLSLHRQPAVRRGSKLHDQFPSRYLVLIRKARRSRKIDALLSCLLLVLSSPGAKLFTLLSFLSKYSIIFTIHLYENLQY